VCPKGRACRLLAASARQTARRAAFPALARQLHRTGVVVDALVEAVFGFALDTIGARASEDRCRGQIEGVAGHGVQSAEGNAAPRRRVIDERDFEGTLVLERLAEIGRVEDSSTPSTPTMSRAPPRS
jgi:hypothetical protein